LVVSIGAAGIPHAGTVMMVIVMNAVGLPTDAVLVILAVDRVLDMCRTTVNVWSDAVGAAIIDRFERDAG
jgi:Na+/H+-dicarboxylate symporter